MDRRSLGALVLQTEVAAQALERRIRSAKALTPNLSTDELYAHSQQLAACAKALREYHAHLAGEHVR